MGRSHRRRPSRKVQLISAAVAASAVAGTAVALAGSAQAASLGAAFSKTSTWDGGYTGQYVITNSSGQTLSGWTLKFDLPSGTSLSSLWNGRAVTSAAGAAGQSGHQITVTGESWDASIPAGRSVTVGFVATTSGVAGDPQNCLINNASCSVSNSPAPTPSGRPTASPSASATATPTPAPTPSATATATPTPSPSATAPSGSGAGPDAGFSPYVDTTLYPAYDLTAAQKATGVKQFNLAFITAGGGCTPEWGGSTDLGSNATANEIGALRSAGGDVRASFGGEAGTELAQACSSVPDLVSAYDKVINEYKLTKADFDVEGAAIADTASNTRRDQAIAQLQKEDPGLDVSFTLPAMPTGLTQDGINLLSDAKSNGVNIGAVDIMAMDYGSSYSGDMGQYAIDGATATEAQVKSVLGISDADAWKKIAVTPMIGVNDVNSETFTVADATALVNFAKSKGLAWLSMWSAARDQQCSGGAVSYAQDNCSSVVQSANAFADAFKAYTG